MKPYDASVHFNTAGAVDNYTLQNAPIWMDIDPITGLITGQGSVLGELTENITVTGTNELGFAVSNTFSIEVAYVKTPYWRLYVTDGGSSRAYIYEIEMRATLEGADQCNGGIARASINSSTAYLSFDDNTGTKWTNDNVNPYWLSYEFLSDTSVLEFAMWPYEYSGAFYNPVSFYLQYSYDNVAWTTVYSITDIPTGTWYDLYTNQQWTSFARFTRFKGAINSVQTDLGTPFKYSVKDLFYPSGGDAISYDLNNAPAWMSIDINGLITGTPDTEGTDTDISVTYETVNGLATSNTFSVETVLEDAAHTYWRLYVTDGGSSRAYLREMEMRASIDGADQCNGGTATANRNRSTAYLIFDNDTETKWTNDNGNPYWIRYEFLSDTSVLEFTLLGHDSGIIYNPTEFYLQYSHDNITWTTVFFVTGLTWVINETKTFTV